MSTNRSRKREQSRLDSAINKLMEPIIKELNMLPHNTITGEIIKGVEYQNYIDNVELSNKNFNRFVDNFNRKSVYVKANHNTIRDIADNSRIELEQGYYLEIVAKHANDKYVILYHQVQELKAHVNNCYSCGFSPEEAAVYINNKIKG